MNKSCFGKFVYEMRPWSTLNIHIQPSPEIWFETKHFENLSFWAHGSRFQLSPLDQEMILEKNYHGLLKFGNFN